MIHQIKRVHAVRLEIFLDVLLFQGFPILTELIPEALGNMDVRHELRDTLDMREEVFAKVGNQNGHTLEDRVGSVTAPTLQRAVNDLFSRGIPQDLKLPLARFAFFPDRTPEPIDQRL
jgi:hypothetical protein